MKNEFKVIADLIEKDTRVLDVGCADGTLMKFLKDNKNFLLIGFALISIVLITSISYQSFTSNQNARAAEIYDAWFTGLAAESADSDETNINFNSCSFSCSFSNSCH